MDEDLYAAAIAGDADAIAKLEVKADRRMTKDEETILHTESEYGNTEHVRFLLKEFSNKNLLVKLTKYKHTALHLAVYHGHTEVAKVLIEAARHLPSSSSTNDPISPFQAFLRQGDKDMDTALHVAVMKGRVAIAKLLVEADPTDRHIQNNEGKTPLYIAAKRGYTEIVKIMCTTCTSPSFQGPRGSTALHAAAKNLDHGIEVVEVLIGAARLLSSSSSDKDNTQSLVSSFQAFLRQGDNDFNTALHLAVMEDKVAIVKLLVEADPSDWHIQNNEGKTPIYLAAEKGSKDIVKVICTTCTAPSLDGPLGSTALHAAIKNLNHDIELVEVLIGEARLLSSSSEKDNSHSLVSSFQFFLRQGDEDLNTALHIAVTQGNLAIVKLLVEADPSDRHIQNNEGKTPIYIAAENGYKDIVKVICTICTAPSLDGPHGSTALHGASKNLDQGTEVVEVLIAAARLLSSSSDSPVSSFQAFLGQSDHHLNTALHISVMEGNVAVVKMLVEADPSDWHIQNNEGKTPIYIAAEKGYKDIVKLICTTCTAPSNLDGPGSRTVLHAAIKHLDQDIEAIKVLISAARQLPACSSSDDEVVEFLPITDSQITPFQDFLRQAPSNLDGPGSRTVLHAAIKHLDQDIEAIKVLISAARQLPACSSSDDEVVEFLPITDSQITPFQDFLRQGDEDLNTALHIAVMQGSLAIAKLLVEEDPTDTHTQNNEGETPIYIAAEKGYNDIVKVICTTCTAPSLDGPCGSTALHAAIRSLDHDVEVVKLLIGAAKSLHSSSTTNDDTYDHSVTSPLQAFLRQGDEDSNTALHEAVMQGRLATVKILVEADPGDGHIQNSKGETPIYIAAERGYNEIVNLICTTCTAPSLDGPRGSTALHAALRNLDHDIEVVKLLIDTARNLYSSSFPSADDNLVTSFQAFLRQGDEDLDTALHVAVMQGKLAAVRLLVEADPSDRHIQNNKGETPIYTAVERGYYDIVKLICTTCTAPINLDGPRGTALHAAFKNLDQAKQEGRDVIRMIMNAIKCAKISEYENIIGEKFVELFSKTDECRRTILELAVERNYMDMVEMILVENPDYQYWIGYNFISLVPLIYKAKDKKYNDIVKLLTERYEVGAQYPSFYKETEALISAIRRRDTVSVIRLLDDYAEDLVTFADNCGWTALHHAAYHEFDSIIQPIIEAQKKFGCQFVYKDRVSTPFHVAAEKGYTSTVIRLLQIWPPFSSAYTAVDKNGQNILHLAALQSKKNMIKGILSYCPKKYKNAIVNKQDNNGNTPLHLLIQHGCFIPEFMKYQGLDTMVKNREEWTPPDMLYYDDQIIGDQVQIRIALYNIQINQKEDTWESLVLPSKRETKDVIFNEKLARMKEDLERYKTTHAVADWFNDAIIGDANARAALEMKADVQNKEGETILHLEAKKGDIENVRFILTEFANKNLLVKADKLNQTALHLAVHHGHTQVVEVLIDAARLNLTTSSSSSSASTFEAFIRQPAGPMRNTGLHVAVLNGNVDIVKLLLEADPTDRHIQNKEGKTPIYIAAENGYQGIIQEICATCTALSLEGPRGKMTALHALIKNIEQVTEEPSDVIRMVVNAAKRWSSADDASRVSFEALFSRTEELGSTVLQLAMERNFVDAVKLILQEDPAYQPGREIKRNGLMRLIYEAIDKECSNDITKLLSQTYEAGINPDHKDVLTLILAMKRRDEECVLRLLGDAKNLVTFTEDNGWTPLHYAVYHEFDSILGAIIQAQEEVGHQFVYGNMVSTPFHVAVEYGYTSTLVRLMQLWPASSSASIVANSPYTVLNKDGRNILHLAAADNRKEMVRDILKYCPEKYKDQILKQQDTSGDTPLHLLISHGCFIPELIKHKGLDTMAKNKNNFTPRDMLYFKNDVVADQVQIKIALDDVQTNQSAWNLWAKSTEKKTDIWKSIVPPSKRRIKDVIFDEHKKVLMDEKHEQMKKDLERYKMRTNTQIIVTALITTVTFTVGFTMPGGLRQSGEVDEGLVLLSRKTAFNAFMVSDALALLLSTSSLFFYFLESMNEDPRQVSKLNAASTVLNIVSVMAMMLTFIAGTYLVLSNSPALAITVCIIGSLFFLLIIILLVKIVYDRLHVKRNLD